MLGLWSVAVMTIIMVMSVKASREPATVGAGEFKAKCLELMDRVAETGESLIITKRGRPVARLVRVEEPPKNVFGFAKGMVEWMGDVVSPVSEPWTPDESELLRLSRRDRPAPRRRKGAK
jgi:prevent-host-death family protein